MPAWSSTQVICRAEGRADQRPLRFRWQSVWLEVEAVEGESLERGPAQADPTYRVFRVTAGGGLFDLRIQDTGWLWQCRQI